MHFSSVRLARWYTSSTVNVYFTAATRCIEVGLPPFLRRAAVDDVGFVQMDMRLDEPPHTRQPPASNTGPSACSVGSMAAMRPSITPISTGGASGACDSLALRTIRSIAAPARGCGATEGGAIPRAVRGTTFQMSAAYSRMARSEENQPTRAVFSTLERHQARRIVPARRDPALHRGIGGEVRGHHEVVVAVSSSTSSRNRSGSSGENTP